MWSEAVHHNFRRAYISYVVGGYYTLSSWIKATSDIEIDQPVALLCLQSYGLPFSRKPEKREHSLP